MEEKDKKGHDAQKKALWKFNTCKISGLNNDTKWEIILKTKWEIIDFYILTTLDI